MARGKFIKDYIVGFILMLSIIGIPLVIGYLNKLISNKIAVGDKANSRIMVGSYAPIIDRYLSGILFILFASLPFALIFFVQGVYVWSLSTNIGSIGFIRSINSLLAVFMSIFATYLIPFFVSVQAYRNTYNRRFDEVLFEFMIPNLYSRSYLKYFIVFFILSIGYSSISYAGTLSLIFYFFAIIVTPGYIIISGNLIANGLYKP
jgi:hypothetical protein